MSKISFVLVSLLAWNMIVNKVTATTTVRIKSSHSILQDISSIEPSISSTIEPSLYPSTFEPSSAPSSVSTEAPSNLAIVPTNGPSSFSFSPAPTSISASPTSVSSAPTPITSAPTSVTYGPTSVSTAPTSISSAPTSITYGPTSVSSAPTSVSSAPTTLTASGTSTPTTWSNSESPSQGPTAATSMEPSLSQATSEPSSGPTSNPTIEVTIHTQTPTSIKLMPSMVPSFAQTTNVPSSEPTNGVALSSQGPTQLPTSSPSLGTSTSPTSTPISTSSKLPSFSPSSAPTSQRIKPSYRPSSEPSQEPTIETNEPTVVTLKPILRSTKKPSTKPVVVTTRPSVSSSISSVSVMPTAPLSASCNGPIIPPPITYLPAQFTLVQPFGNYTGSSVSNSSLSVFAVTLQCILRGNKYAAFTPLILASLSSNANPTIALTAIQPTTIYVAFIVKFFVPPTSSTLLSAYYGNLTSAISASFVSGQFTAVLHQIAQTQHLSIALGSVVAQQQAPIYTKAVPLGVSSAPLKNVQPSNSPVASSSSTNSGTNDFFSTGNMPVYILVIAIAILLPVLIWLWCSSGRRRPDRIDLADKQLQNWTIAPVVDVPIVSKHIVTKPQKSNSVEDFYYEVSQKQAVPRNAGPLSNAHSAVVAPTDSRYNRNQKAMLNEYLKSQRDQQRSNPSYLEPTREVSPRPNLNSSSSSNNGMYDTATAGPRMWNAADADVSDPWEEEYRYKEYQQFQSWMEENPAAKENAAIDPEPWQRDEQYRKYREFQGKKDDVISTQKILQQQLLEFELQKELMKSRPPPPVQQSSHSNRDYGYNQSRSNRDYQPERERDPRGLDQGYSSRERPRGERSRKDDRDYGRERPYSQREYDEREGGQYSRGPRDKSRERQRDIERDRSRRR